MQEDAKEMLDAMGVKNINGYDANGNRVYDKVKGQTCHQCRQKTLGKRTCCSGCQSLQVCPVLHVLPRPLGCTFLFGRT